MINLSRLFQRLLPHSLIFSSSWWWATYNNASNLTTAIFRHSTQPILKTSSTFPRYKNSPSPSSFLIKCKEKKNIMNATTTNTLLNDTLNDQIKTKGEKFEINLARKKASFGITLQYICTSFSLSTVSFYAVGHPSPWWEIRSQ